MITARRVSNLLVVAHARSRQPDKTRFESDLAQALRSIVAAMVERGGFGEDPAGTEPIEILPEWVNPVTRHLILRSPVTPFFEASQRASLRMGVKYTFVVVLTPDGPRLRVGPLGHQDTGRFERALAAGEIYFSEVDFPLGGKRILVERFNLQSGSYRHHASRAVFVMDALVAAGFLPSELVEMKVDSGLSGRGGGHIPIVDLASYVPIY